MTIDIRPMIEDVSQVMTKHITNILSGVIGEYNIYKETHETIMGLPCVRKLHERIAELEDGTTTNTTARTTCANTREDEISQLQGAIADLNRYIRALESKVDMKSVVVNKEEDEESVKLEIREEDSGTSSDDDTDDVCIVSSTHKNVIISAAASVPFLEAEAEDAEADAEAEAEEAEDAEAEEAEAEEAEDAEADAEAEEAEIEVSEVKIKGKTYFTTDAVNGIIYACVDEDVGDEVGVFKNGVAVFNKGKK